MKRHILVYILLFTSVFLHAQTTLKEQLVAIHEAFGVNFVYDSSLDLDRIAGHSRPDRESLESRLTDLFEGTDIDWEIKKRYVVLTGKGKKSGYAILIKSQVDTLEEARVTA